MTDDLKVMAIRRAGQIVGSVLHDLTKATKPGATPKELDQLAANLIGRRGGQGAFLGYQGYPATICVSVNDAVVHGIPTDRPFKEGDLVGIDVGARVDGFCADGAVTLGLGRLDLKAKRLLMATKRALAAGIARVRSGVHLGDVQAAIQATIEVAGFGIIRDLVGHGIGRELHEPPQIPNYGRAGEGLILKTGMTICLEPMVTLGRPEVMIDPTDHWTVRTKDGSLGAQFEHTILVTEVGGEILTPSRAWPKA